MSGEDLKLLGKRESRFTSRIVWALKLKGIEFEFIEEDIFNKSPLLLKSNPVLKKSPVLIHCGKPIPESPVILEYIDETWKQYPLLPEDPQERAYVRFWAKFVDEKFNEATTKACLSTGEDQVKWIQSIAEALQFLEVEITGKRFFGGERIGFLDIVAGWITFWFGCVEELGDFKVMEPTKYPKLDSWFKNFLQVPVIKENLPPREDVCDIFLKIRNMRI